ncbi:hypothetical protein AB0D08_10170 [Kitasatospora sp. NPDC048540]|uniref:hypothetical protein n=1 Tax=Kitasatospora sp. NPDC048540 TaxID=3155634 RepID=UPI0033DAC1E3
MTILELRILPPLAVGRLGAATEPMDNYEVTVDPEQPLAARRIRPARTFVVDPDTGGISSDAVPSAVRFTVGGKVRPVAPFLEVWALTDTEGMLEPLTTALLAEHGLTPRDVRWSVEVANHKIHRRTGEERDRIDAVVPAFSDHDVHRLEGTCPNFWAGRTLPLGTVRYLRPTEGFPGIRLRFTPAAGLVYGSSAQDPQLPQEAPDPNLAGILYNANLGGWLGHFDREGDPSLTVPANIYRGWDDDGRWRSSGYLDDECDGLVHVELRLAGRADPLRAYARIGAGPPAYAPDSFPVRTVADELDQAMFGPEATDIEAGLEGRAQAEEIIRRALESVRLMNTAVMNGNTVNGRTDVASTMVRQDTADTGRRFEPVMAPSLVDNAALLHLHRSILTGLRSGTAPWFADVLRNHNEIGDLSAKGRRKMPALMRGADGRALALTRRQVDLIRKVARRDVFAAESSGP